MFSNKKKWNISIIVIFILALISLMSLLSASYIREIISSSWQLQDYYRAHYLAKAWVETNLIAVNEHGIWFETQIGSWDNIQKSFSCFPNCWFKTSIIARTHYMDWSTTYSTSNEFENECTQDNIISIQPKEIWSVPLFYDESNNSWAIALHSILSTNLDIWLEVLSNNTKVALWISLWEWWQQLIDRHSLFMSGQRPNLTINDFLQNINVTYINSWDILSSNNLIYSFDNQTNVIWPIAQTFHNLYNYLLIANDGDNWDWSLDFCITVANKDSEIPRSLIVIQSEWLIWTKSASVQARKKLQIPDFLFSTYLNN